MANPSPSGLSDAKIPQIDKELTHAVLISQARRKLLVALAICGSQSGADLKHVGRGFSECSSHKVFTRSTIANLRKMVEAGLVLKHGHGSDGRRVLYCLSPAVKVTRVGSDYEFDFGFGVARLDADGN